MYIKTVYDLIEFAREHLDYTYTYYAGEHIVYDKNNNLINDVKFNHLMMYYLEEFGLLEFQGYCISHKAVRYYKISNIKDFEKRVEDVKNTLEVLISKSKDLKVKSLKHLIEYFKNDFYIFYDKESEPVSYWGGGREINYLFIDAIDKNRIFKFPYYYAPNLKNNLFHSMIMNFYSRIFEGFDEEERNYREYITKNSFKTSKEYFDLRNKAYNEIYKKLLNGVKV